MLQVCVDSCRQAAARAAACPRRRPHPSPPASLPAHCPHTPPHWPTHPTPGPRKQVQHHLHPGRAHPAAAQDPDRAAQAGGHGGPGHRQGGAGLPGRLPLHGAAAIHGGAAGCGYVGAAHSLIHSFMHFTASTETKGSAHWPGRAEARHAPVPQPQQGCHNCFVCWQPALRAISQVPAAHRGESGDGSSSLGCQLGCPQSWLSSLRRYHADHGELGGRVPQRAGPAAGRRRPRAAGGRGARAAHRRRVPEQLPHAAHGRAGGAVRGDRVQLRGGAFVHWKPCRGFGSCV